MVGEKLTLDSETEGNTGSEIVITDPADPVNLTAPMPKPTSVYDYPPIVPIPGKDESV